MVHHLLRSLVRSLVRYTRTATLLGTALAAAAQPTSDTAARPAADTAQPKARRDPLDAKAIVPQASYRSSFTQFKGLGDDKPISWREANDTVTQIGGWRVYAREAQQPEPAPSSVPSLAPSPAPKPVQPAPAASSTEHAKPRPAGPSGHTGQSGDKRP